MTKIQRETATHLADLPHEFEAHPATRTCDVCQSDPGDPRHVAFERARLADRERASADGFSREIGS